MRDGLPLTLLLLAGCADGASPGLASLELSPDSSIHFPVIGDTLALGVQATDGDGRVLTTDNVRFVSRDAAVAEVDRVGQVRSIGDGVAYIVGSVGSATDSVRVSVAQARDSLVLRLPFTHPIVSLPGDAPFPLTCRVFDANGSLVVLGTSVTSRTGRVEGTVCGSLVARSSGHDTLIVQAGPYQSAIPVVVAIRPVVLTDPALPLAVDSIPRGASPWAPTLVKTSQGEIHLYFAAYYPAPYPLNGKQGHLHRLVTTDGVSFQYDGIALRRDPTPCSLQGTGIENVTVVPRAEATGWRMYFSAGSSSCYGWQVFSAVSSDERQWIKETGIRIPNGGVVPPADPELPPWPAGEGMVVEPLPSGEWRMLVGSYERIRPPENRFQITDWQSSDQIHWSYQGPVLTTRQVGPGANRSVYSPAVQDLAPGLRRMYFAGDNLDAAGGASRIYSAVSVDGESWQIEGVVLSDGAADYFYCTVVDDLLVFIRDVAGSRSLAGVRLETR